MRELGKLRLGAGEWARDFRVSDGAGMVPWGTEWAPRKSQLKAFSPVLMMCNCFLRIKRAFYPREMLKIFCGKKGEREERKKG